MKYRFLFDSAIGEPQINFHFYRKTDKIMDENQSQLNSSEPYNVIKKVIGYINSMNRVDGPINAIFWLRRQINSF